MKKRLLTTVMISSMMLSSAVLPLVASADSIANSDKKIAELSSKEAQASAELQNVRSTIADIQAEAATLQAEQETLNKETKKLSEEIATLTDRIEKREAAIKDQARSVQVDGQGTSFVDAVLNAESVSDALTRVAAATRLVGAGNDLMVEQQSDKKSVESKKAETDKKAEKLTENAIALEAKKGELVTQELQKAAVVNTLSAEKATEQSKKDKFVAEAKAAEAALKAQAKAVEKTEAKAEVNETEALTEETTQPKANKSTSKEETTQTEVQKEETPAQTEPQKETPAQTEPQKETPTEPQKETPAPAPSGNASAILAEAAKHVGKPYVWGAKGPDSFDCSGFTAYVYRKVTGREIGGYTVPQESAGTTISVSEAKAGDLYFWGGHGGTYHVAIATGNGGYIHAPAPGQGVSYSSVGYYAPDFAVRM